VLIRRDSKTASHFIHRTLAEIQIESHIVNDPRQTLNALKQFNSGSDSDGHVHAQIAPRASKSHAIIRQHCEFLSIPIVYLSVKPTSPCRRRRHALGRCDPFSSPSRSTRFFLNHTHRQEQDRALPCAAPLDVDHDSLTGLLNHSSGKEHAGRPAVRHRAIEGGFLSVVMLDIDHLNRSTTATGTQLATSVIRSLSWLLKQRLRKPDMICRYGGRSFLIGPAAHRFRTGLLQSSERIRQISRIHTRMVTSFFDHHQRRHRHLSARPTGDALITNRRPGASISSQAPTGRKPAFNISDDLKQRDIEIKLRPDQNRHDFKSIA